MSAVIDDPCPDPFRSLGVAKWWCPNSIITLLHINKTASFSSTVWLSWATVHIGKSNAWFRIVCLFPSAHDMGPMSLFVECYSEVMDLKVFEVFQSMVVIILNHDHNVLPLAPGNFFELAPDCFDLVPIVFDVSLAVCKTRCSSSSCMFPTWDPESAFSPGEVSVFSGFLLVKMHLKTTVWALGMFMVQNWFSFPDLFKIKVSWVHTYNSI